jgi:hypothetical protein
MSTTRRDLEFVVYYDEATGEFETDVLSDVTISDDTSNRSSQSRERVRVSYGELDAAEQALGTQFIAALQGVRDTKRPVNLPPTP